MEVIPAIDLRGGRCVRLAQGDYRRETVFDEDPVAVGLRWVQAGACRVHVVDLDGARAGVRVNAAVVKALVEAIPAPVQLGGGIRSARTAGDLLALGVDRVIFGTAALEAPEEVAETVAAYGAERVIVSVDARGGLVATRGWTQGSGMAAADLMEGMAELGVRRFIYTDISRDGTLEHPNFRAIGGILRAVRYPVVVAGGVASVEDLLELGRMGVEGAVTGLAIYTGAIDLRAAIETVAAAGL
ncbi:MAG: 1-(5-phosphoribosyl)-5-[(5-phosphoribosylamino)methylideneamino]imidazole-4-carboxamide isomerase [Gemmatimonadetes bacterium]|nr:1-(5-phosphoribosyl)-5-[(5-phosphoribosylamino)methylideneamino]imidazole-4-carboxamide isomerase [Gemmatimonadota bacterium]